MGIRIVKLGSPRHKEEGIRIGTVRRPPRGVPKSDYSKLNFYDVWQPLLSPSPELMAVGKSAQTEKDWQAFFKKFRKEMQSPDASRLLDLLASFSHTTDFSVGCYCEDEGRCHRKVLRELLGERGADLIG